MKNRKKLNGPQSGPAAVVCGAVKGVRLPVLKPRGKG